MDPQGTPTWLTQNGPKQLEILFRAIVYQPTVPILLTDDDRRSCEVTVGASKLFGLPRETIIGRSLDELTAEDFRPLMEERWRAFLDHGEQHGVLQLAGPDGKAREVPYVAKGNVLPVRHLFVLGNEAGAPVPPWVQDYALFLLNPDGTIAAWYAGAQRIYGYSAAEALNEHVSLVHPPGEEPSELAETLTRAAGAGHIGWEGWQNRKDGTRFWANLVLMALKSDGGKLEGFAGVVRDFTKRHERDENLRRHRARVKPIPSHSTIAGIVSGEFEKISDANDAFLGLIGYTRDDLVSGRIQWPDLTPPEYAPFDEFAHEEGLRFGACTPFEKELICKNGSRAAILAVTAVLGLSPFRWITFVQDLRQRDRLESLDADDGQRLKKDFGEIVGVSAALRRVQRQVELVAPTDANVLILGETGTGKELVARAIHRRSPRHDRTFITLNCAAIPTGLLESELFGYERGAFTGALSQKLGRFELAHRGTLFLDEVGDIPLDLQPKLLRALQEKSFERLGGTKTIPIDVRLIAATNRNLAQMMGDNLFRSDLYYRLKVFPITTPPLRDRSEDIPVLARHFTKKYAEKMGRPIEKIPADTMRALVEWRWPGNIRELENFIERSVILSRGPNLRSPLAELRPDASPAAASATLEQVEREHIIRVLRESGNVVTLAASRLGLHRTTLNAMMLKLGITRRDL